MNIVVYTKSSCPNCVAAKQLLKSKGLQYSEWDVEQDPDALARLSPDWRQMPQIFINDQRVGGLQAALKQIEGAV